jgi:hypothetical protein
MLAAAALRVHHGEPTTRGFFFIERILGDFAQNVVPLPPE